MALLASSGALLPLLPPLILLLLSIPTTSGAFTATTLYGSVQGSASNGVVYFRGIPYASPPVGSLRWQRPSAPQNWTGVRNATEYGPTCMQASLGPPGGGGPPNIPGGIGPGALSPMPSPGPASPSSEDCLYLNVYVPQNAFATGARLPVMVWIHGGAFKGGSGSDSTWDGTTWLPQLKSEVVLVTINYRLGAFGFLGSWQLQADGGALNLGLLDQRQALIWVKKNIAAFSGNPKRVTVFGESAGAVSIGCHLLFKNGKQRLFRRAILESGSYPSLFTGDLTSLTSAQKVFDALATNLGCNKSSPSVLECMKGKNASAVLAAVPEAPSYGNLNLSPILETPYFSKLPQKLASSGLLSHVPLIAGTNTAEGRVFLLMSGAAIDNATQFAIFVNSFLPTLGTRDQSRARALYNPTAYFSTYPNPFFRAATELLGDVKFICNSDYLAAMSSKKSNKAFRFRFNVTTNGQEATHGEELSYVFPSNGSSSSTSNNIFLKSWPYFAYYGIPSSNMTFWPHYTNGTQLVINSAESTTLEGTSAIHLKRCAFWRTMEAKYFRKLTT